MKDSEDSKRRHTMQIYVSKSGQRYGPYDATELRAAVLANVFQPEHFASCDNGKTWRLISEIRELGSIAYMVERDPEKALLVIRYRGRVESSDLAACVEEVADALADMPAGFRLLVDLTALESMDVACAPHLKEIMLLCDAKGIDAVVRVVPDARRDIGLQIMSRFHYRPTVKASTYKSLDEAASVLTGVRHDPASVEVPLDEQHD